MNGARLRDDGGKGARTPAGCGLSGGNSCTARRVGHVGSVSTGSSPASARCLISAHLASAAVLSPCIAAIKKGSNTSDVIQTFCDPATVSKVQ
eukprot:4009073-Prymnesium_polylepis.3